MVLMPQVFWQSCFTASEIVWFSAITSFLSDQLAWGLQAIGVDDSWAGKGSADRRKDFDRHQHPLGEFCTKNFRAVLQSGELEFAENFLIEMDLCCLAA